MIRYNIHKNYKTSINKPSLDEGETIETKIERIVNNNEPITDGAPIIYMDRKEGVIPDYDIRTDRWEVAIDGMDVVAKSQLAKREQRQKTADTGKQPESTQGTEPPKPAA